MTLCRAAACARLVLLALAAACSEPLAAADLAIGIVADITAMDPHYPNVTPNHNATAADRVRCASCAC